MISPFTAAGENVEMRTILVPLVHKGHEVTVRFNGQSRLDLIGVMSVLEVSNGTWVHSDHLTIGSRSFLPSFHFKLHRVANVDRRQK